MISKIWEDLTKALKAKDKLKVSVIRLLIADIHDQKIEKQAELTDEEVVALIRKGIKQRQEAIDLYLQGKRGDLVAKEKEELDILNTYLPQQLSPQELEKIVKDTISLSGVSGPQDFGKVMGLVMGKIKGRAEGNLVAQIVRQSLIPPGK